MLFDLKSEKQLVKLEAQLYGARAITPELMSKVIAEACVRLAAHSTRAKAKLHRLIECCAWTDATLALIELELPQWKLRRLVYEDGKWLCSFSKQPNLPVELDDTADGSHEVLPLAILGALLDVRRRPSMASRPSSPTVPQVRAMMGSAVCCDNFA